MRITHLPLTLALVLLPACGDDVADAADAAAHANLPSPAGQWVVDAEHLATTLDAALRSPDSKVPADQVDAEVAKARSGARSVLELSDDGTFTATGSMAGEPVDDAGTWKLDGDRLTMQWSRRTGKASAHSQVVQWAGKTLDFKPDPTLPFDIRMKRK